MTDFQTLFDVRGSTAVITGGSGVLGSAMALALAKAGVRVAILSLHAASSAKVVQAIQAENGEAIGIACDILLRTDLERACTEVLKTFGPIDMLINAAKAAVANFTQWLAVHMAREYSFQIRVKTHPRI
jgi:NAD(P)-dependent dehydrogenase (short-subunit alcohol dehydrogenase family)